MKFAVITHVKHHFHDGKFYAYGPYVREMNLWFTHVDEVLLIAPSNTETPSDINLTYKAKNLKNYRIPSLSITSFTETLRTIILIPGILFRIWNVMRKADHIHLRCPGTIGLLGCFVQILFPKKTKTAKYAGNWDPKSIQPLSYRLQKKILNNTFFTRNMQVLVYGEWEGMSKNIKPFFTATYRKNKIGIKVDKTFKSPFSFLFIGSLVAGKQPLYAIQLVENLLKKGIICRLDLYGDGILLASLKQYVNDNLLMDAIYFHGNKESGIVEKAYKKSQFLVLPSKSEGWPKVIAEAMFWGVIPIASSISCVPWMLNKGERGVLLKMILEEDIKQLEECLRNHVELNEMSQNAQSWSHNYTLDDFEFEIKKLL